MNHHALFFSKDESKKNIVLSAAVLFCLALKQRFKMHMQTAGGPWSSLEFLFYFTVQLKLWLLTVIMRDNSMVLRRM